MTGAGAIQGEPAFADITAVVVSYEAGDGLIETLRALPGRSSFHAVILVDSGSTDGSPERAAEAFPGLRVVRHDRNVGPCVTRNRGLAEAATGLVLLLDDDMRLGPGTVERLREELLQSPLRAAAGPRIAYADRPGTVQYEGGICHYAGLPHIRHLGAETPPGAPVEVDVLSSGCLLVRREAVLAAGGFNPDFFYLMEDVELSLRLRYLGWRLVVVPRASAWNAGASQGLSLAGRQYPARRVFLHARNRCLMILSLYHPWTLFVLALPLAFFEAAWFVFAVLGGHPLAYLRGKAAILPRIGGVLEWRRRLRGRKRLSDRDLLRAPPLTFTPTALAQPLARSFAAALDGVMRLFWGLVKGALP